MFNNKKDLEAPFPANKLFRNEEGKISVIDENGKPSLIFQKYVDILKECIRSQESIKKNAKNAAIIGSSIFGASLIVDFSTSFNATLYQITTMLTASGAFMTIWGTLQNLGSRSQIKNYQKRIQKVESNVLEGKIA